MDASFFNLYVACDDKELGCTLASLVTLKNFNKGDLILEMGAPQKWIYFLYSGFACAYILEHDGAMTVDCIMDKPGMPVMPCANLAAPSPNYIEALSDCVLARLDLQHIKTLCKTTPGLSDLVNSYLAKAWADHHELEMALRRLPARQRYEWFLSKFPGAIDAVPHSRIASFLGMSPITLSRVRTAIATR